MPRTSREALILASTSPRRRHLLEQLGIPFEVVPPDASESMVGEGDPEQLVLRNACAKAEVVAARFPDRLVVAADTIVLIDGLVFGKPRDAEEAARMLRTLAGREHRVLSGVAVARMWGDLCLSRAVNTLVWMTEMTVAEIAAYVSTGEPMDKAGAYAIQGKGACLVREIRGCYSNVVGLPLATLVQLLQQAGFPLW